MESCNRDAVKMAHQLALSFPCFRDVASYKGRGVAFLKRAQIFAADIWNRFGGMGYGEFKNIGDLTMFADYRCVCVCVCVRERERERSKYVLHRVPQALQFFGVLHYSSSLLARLREGVELAQGSEEEIEIRACSIWAVEASFSSSV